MDLERRLADLWFRPVERLPDDIVFPRGESAVLLLIVPTPGDPGLVLTRRSPTMRTDPDFVALPGGRCELGESAAQTARRETCEEIGISPDDITVRGRFDDAWSSAGYRVTPVVATTDVEIDLRDSSTEVAETRVVSLTDLADPSRRRTVTKEIDGHIYVDEVIDLDDWEVHGLTADLVIDLLDWAEGADRRRVDERRADLVHFAPRRW
jgi:8-oxo-dGTP pyrophosphatase MutT (NUDIX family)